MMVELHLIRFHLKTYCCRKLWHMLRCIWLLNVSVYLGFGFAGPEKLKITEHLKRCSFLESLFISMLGIICGYKLSEI